jgi:heme b synthase
MKVHGQEGQGRLNHEQAAARHGHKQGLELRLIFWELTSRCNLRCIHCRAEAGFERSPKELTTEETYGLIEQVVDFARPIMVLTGGEPLLRPDIYDIARYAADKGLRCALASNGTLIDDQAADNIVEAGIRRVSISIDGANPRTHDSFRGEPGSFGAALAGFRRLKERGMSLQFNSTIARHNLDELKAIVDLAEGMEADAIHIFMLVPVGCGLTIADDQMIPAEKYEEVLNWFYTAASKSRLEMKATCAPHYFRIMRERAREEGVKVTRVSHGMAAVTRGCLAATGVCFISREGVVQPCGYLPVAVGNIRQQTLKEIWEDSPIFKTLRQPGLLKGKCGRCEYRVVCEGCRARAFAKTGDYMEEEPYCIYEPSAKRRKDAVSPLSP